MNRIESVSYTHLSGTGACAAAGVAYKLGMTNNKVIVQMPGGELQVEIEEDWNVFMTGDVFYVAKITLSNEFCLLYTSLKREFIYLRIWAVPTVPPRWSA